MKKSNQLRLHFILFLILSVVAIAQLSWWVIFQVKEGSRITSQQTEVWNQQIIIARAYFEIADLADAEKSLWLKTNFPDLQLEKESRVLIVTADAQRRLNNLAQKRVRMFVSEGAFFSLLVLSGVWFFYWALRKRIELENRTVGILGAASSGLKNPISTLKTDIEKLLSSGQSDSSRNELINRISSNVRKIADTCESVSLIQMLTASRRKIKLEMVNISEDTETVVNHYKDSQIKPDLEVASDVEKNLTAVTNPAYWSKIVWGLLRIVDNHVAEKTVINAKFGRESNSAILKIKCMPVMGNREINDVRDEIESELGIIRELAETIGVKIKVLPDDGNTISLEAELPLLEE